MSVEIFEDKYDQDKQSTVSPERAAAKVVLENAEMESDEAAIDSLLKRIDFYRSAFENGNGEIVDKMKEWENIDVLYQQARVEEKDPTVDARVNVILPNIEGQVSSMVNTAISGSYNPKGISDYKWASTAGAIGETILKENNIKQKVKTAGRKYLKFGHVFGKTVWDYKGFDGMGIPKMKVLPLGTVVVDRKIKSIWDTEDGDYIIEEKGVETMMEAYDLYGDEIADAIQRGNMSITGIRLDESTADTEGYTKLEVWTRNNKYNNLQLLAMSSNGIPLEISNPKEPYYKFVNNKYPIRATGLYEVENEFYPFGDGKALMDIQLLINKIYDEIVLAMKYSSQGTTFASIRARLNIRKFIKRNPAEPVIVTNPALIKTERGAGIHEVVFRLLEQLFMKVQEVTRFSALMSGNAPSETMTATQAGIQMQQGTAGIDDKRSDLSTMFGEMLDYGIGMCMEFWTKGQAFRVVDDPDKFQWIDARELSRVPEMKPAETEYLKRYKKRNPNRTAPEFQIFQTTDENGKKIDSTKRVGLDVIVSIGQGLPNNKITMYNLIIQLAQLQLIDENGQARSLMTFEQAQKMISDILGIKFGDVFADSEAKTLNMQNQDVARAARISPLNQDANVPNANVSGAVGGQQNVV